MKKCELINADCLTILKTMPDKSIDLCLTDPPYGVGFDYDIYEDNEENLNNILKIIYPEILRVGKRVVSFSGNTALQKYPKFDWLMSYSYDTTANYCKFGFNQWQPILIYGQDLKGFGKINGVIKSDSIHFSGGSGIGFLNKNKTEKHPCAKPLHLMEYLIKRFSNENDLILDPFMGSGTTGMAALKLNRKFIGIEISPDYFKLAQERIKPYIEQKKLFEAIE